MRSVCVRQVREIYDLHVRQVCVEEKARGAVCVFWGKGGIQGERGMTQRENGRTWKANAARVGEQLRPPNSHLPLDLPTITISWIHYSAATRPTSYGAPLASLPHTNMRCMHSHRLKQQQQQQQQQQQCSSPAALNLALALRRSLTALRASRGL